MIFSYSEKNRLPPPSPLSPGGGGGQNDKKTEKCEKSEIFKIITQLQNNLAPVPCNVRRSHSDRKRIYDSLKTTCLTLPPPIKKMIGNMKM